MDEVTLERSTTTRNNDWRFNFATAGEILAPVAPEDPTLVNPPLRLRLGWAPALLAALGAPACCGCAARMPASASSGCTSG